MRKLIIILFAFMFLSHCIYGQKLKVATYNIFFLDNNISAERKSNLQNVIQTLDADIIAFQEIDNEDALKNILPENYIIAMIDDPDEILEVALAVRSPYQIIDKKYVFTLDTFDYAFPRNRDLLQVEVKGSNNTFTFLIHHTKSRRGGRMKTDKQRETASSLIVDYIKNDLSCKNVILLGDFNDNPDDRSVNILEMGSDNVQAGIDEQEDTFLFNTSEKLLDNDYCSYGLYKMNLEINEKNYRPIVEGARIENDKWRDKKFNYYKDVKIKAVLFDQILVSMNLKKSVIDAGIYSGIEAIKGIESKIKFVDGEIKYTRRGTLASDHIPVWVVLDFNGEQ